MVGCREHGCAGLFDDAVERLGQDRDQVQLTVQRIVEEAVHRIFEIDRVGGDACGFERGIGPVTRRLSAQFRNRDACDGAVCLRLASSRRRASASSFA